MLRVNHVSVSNLKEAVIDSGNAMRLNPIEYTEEEFQKGLIRAKKLINASKNSNIKCHDNFLTGINVYFDLYYPQYWTPEFQRYNFANIVTSSSKMHRLLKMNLDEACNKYVSQSQIDTLNYDINVWNEINDLKIESYKFKLRNGEYIYTNNLNDSLHTAFMKCISDCPMGLELFMAVRTNYKQLQTIYYQRKNHKLEDWGIFIKFIEELPYFKELILGE